MCMRRFLEELGGREEGGECTCMKLFVEFGAGGQEGEKKRIYQLSHPSVRMTAISMMR